MARQLLPHERACDAKGCKRGYVFNIIRVGDDDYQEGWEHCRECDGTGVLLNERRDNSWLRSFLEQTGDVYEKLRAYIHERDRIDRIVSGKLDAAEARVTRLQLENRSLRGQLMEKARLFEQLNTRHREAMRLLDSAIPDHERIAAEGAH